MGPINRFTSVPIVNNGSNFNFFHFAFDEI